MTTFLLYGCAAVGAAVAVIVVAVPVVIAVHGAVRRVRGSVAVRLRRRAGLASGRYRLEDKPGHPERADCAPDPLVEARYWDLVGRLLKDQARHRNRNRRAR